MVKINVMKPRIFADVGVTLHHGDMLKVLPTLKANSVDSCVTDPPYHLTSIVKRFAKENPDDVERNFVARKVKGQGLSPFHRAARGFMGKVWDGGDIAFKPETWREVYRVLKPGAHLLAFGGTRTYHRLVCAIEDAGFEVRDTVLWVTGQGFPKSHSLGDFCDCEESGNPLPYANGKQKTEREVRPLRTTDVSASVNAGEQRKKVLQYGVSQQSLQSDRATRAKSETGGTKQSGLGGRQLYRTGQGLSDGADAGSSEGESERLRPRAHFGSRTKIGTLIKTGRGSPSQEPKQTGQSPEQFTDILDAQRALDEGALRGRGACPQCGKLSKAYEGFGTALKPAVELVALCRKPLSEGTVAANVLKWGVGALNIDGCRVQTADNLNGGAYATNPTEREQMWGEDAGNSWRRGKAGEYKQPTGRWPSNVIHDGSDEVVAGFPDAASTGPYPSDAKPSGNVFGGARSQGAIYSDSGSAARFFYTAKADSDDRLGSKHPTVKPLDLMQYLVRLVCPKGGTVLDCFAGTGTTGEAAWREGMHAVLIEAEKEYQADIVTRLTTAKDYYARETAKMRRKPADLGPLFKKDNNDKRPARKV